MYIRTKQNSESGLGAPPDWSVQRPQTSSQPPENRVPVLLARLKQATNADVKRRIIDDLGVAGKASTSDKVKQSIATELISETKTATNTERVKIAAIQALFLILKQVTDAAIKSQILFALGDAGSAITSDKVKQSIVTELILEMVNNSNTERVRITAIQSLGKIPLDSATEPLLKQLRLWIKIEKLAGLIIWALGEVGRASSSNQVKQSIVTELILEMLNGSNTEWVRTTAIQALGAIRLKSATGPLLKQLRDRHLERIAVYIIVALGEIGDYRAIDLLVIMLEHHQSPIDRREAARALGKIRGSKALAALKRRLSKETDAQVKAAISEALIQRWPSEGVSREGLRWRTSPPPP
jgi:HEAT repeat protein